MAKPLEKITDDFSKEIQQIFQKDLESIILFGSAATDEYKPGVSDLNMMVVLSESGITKINLVQPLVKNWIKQKIATPVFVTKWYIESSLDSFPIEFLNMQLSYKILFGSDVLANLKIDKKDLRLQIEREVKGNLLKLRQGFIETAGKAQIATRLVSDSITAFVSIFKALLFHDGQEIPNHKNEIILQACRKHQLDEQLFAYLLDVKNKKLKLSGKDAVEKMNQYINEVFKLSIITDKN